MNLIYLTLSALIACAHGTFQRAIEYHTRTRYQWNMLEFSFPSRYDWQQAVAKGNFQPTKAMLVDVEPQFVNGNLLRTFVTTPRFAAGTPYTLATISNSIGVHGPMLTPYPNYQAHDNRNGTNCDAIVSAFHISVDECNRMWVIDSGKSSFVEVCPPKLLLIDLNTDQIIHRHHFNRSLYNSRASLLFNFVVDVRDPPPRGDCRHTMVYVADATHHGLLVYNFTTDNAYRIEHRYMYPDPDHGSQYVAGENFELMGGIFGIATDKTNLYFHPIASVTEYAVPLRVLDNRNLFRTTPAYKIPEFQALGKRASACTTSTVDSDNNLYCVTLNPIELLQWNVNTPYNTAHINKIPIRPEELQFIGSMKVIRNLFGEEELWLVSNRYQKTLLGNRDFSEVNFRIISLPLAPYKRQRTLHSKTLPFHGLNTKGHFHFHH